MTLELEFAQIIKSKDHNKLVDFLKPLTLDERRSLRKKLEKLEKEVDKSDFFVERIYEMSDLPPRIRIFEIAAIVIDTMESYDKYHFNVNPDCLEMVAPWGIPKWIDAYIKSKGVRAVFAWTYDRMMTWVENGYISMPPADMVATLLSNAIRDYDTITKRQISLDEHFWLLFEHDVNQDWEDTHIYSGYKDYCEPYEAILKLVADERLDRSRLLHEAVVATNKGFKRGLSVWFVGMVVAANPSVDELIGLQAEIFAVFTSRHSKPVGILLAIIKRIVRDERFAVQDFLMQVSAVFASGVKNNMLKAIALIRMIASDGRAGGAEVATALAGVFMSRDEGVQLKAADVLVKYYSETGREGGMGEVLDSCSAMMLSSVRDRLSVFMDHTAQESSDYDCGGSCFKEEPVPELLEKVKSYEDFLFLVSRMLREPKPGDIDLMIEASLRYGLMGNAVDLSCLQPVLVAAVKISSRWLVSWLRRLIARYVVEYCKVLIERYPENTAVLAPICNSRVCARVDLRNLEVPDVFRPVKSLMIRVLDMLKPIVLVEPERKPEGWFRRIFWKKKDAKNEPGAVSTAFHALPLLSVPTHAPAYISPEAFIDRLEEYARSGVEPDTFDIQIAIARLLGLSGSCLDRIVTWPDCELKRLAIFLMDGDCVKPEGPFEHRAWWVMAALLKSPERIYREFDPVEQRGYLTGEFEWTASMVRNENNGYKWVSHPLKLEGVKREAPGCLMKEPLLVEVLFRGDSGYYDVNALDLDWILWQQPSVPESLLASWTASGFSDSGPAELRETFIRLTAVRGLLTLRHKWRAPSYLLMAAAMLCADSTVRTYAAQIWIEKSGLSGGSAVSSRRLGEYLGKLEAVSWAPIKRFIDLFTQQMCGLGHESDCRLADMIMAMIGEMAETPIPGLGALLVQLRELLRKTGQRISDPACQSRLLEWSCSNSVQKIASELLTDYVKRGDAHGFK